jgi:FkbM family methyltransferase
MLCAPGFRPNTQMQEGAFEPDELEQIQELLRKSDRLIDAGANVGWYTCVARHAGRPAVAIEPQRLNLDCLYQTLELNGWSDTEVVPAGLAETPGVRTLYGASGPGASLVPGWAGYLSTARQTISVTTLDALLHGRFLDERLLIKIDVEGAEYEVLRGAALTLRRMPRPSWFVEICLREYHPGGNPNFAATFELFRAAGYDTYLADRMRTPVTSEDVHRWVEAGHSDSGVINYLFTERAAQTTVG